MMDPEERDFLFGRKKRKTPTTLLRNMLECPRCKSKVVQVWFSRGSVTRMVCCGCGLSQTLVVWRYMWGQVHLADKRRYMSQFKVGMRIRFRGPIREWSRAYTVKSINVRDMTLRAVGADLGDLAHYDARMVRPA